MNIPETIKAYIEGRTEEWKKQFSLPFGGIVNEDSSWLEILHHIEKVQFPYLYERLDYAVRFIEIFSDEERKYLRQAPAYQDIVNNASLSSDIRYRLKTFQGIYQILAYTIETDEKDLYDLDLLVYRPYQFIIINYVPNIPELDKNPQEGYQTNCVLYEYTRPECTGKFNFESLGNGSALPYGDKLPF